VLVCVLFIRTLHCGVQFCLLILLPRSKPFLLAAFVRCLLGVCADGRAGLEHGGRYSRVRVRALAGPWPFGVCCRLYVPVEKAAGRVLRPLTTLLVARAVD
jgi:hypothetical protein